jgi:hypothetical protein
VKVASIDIASLISLKSEPKRWVCGRQERAWLLPGHFTWQTGGGGGEIQKLFAEENSIGGGLAPAPRSWWVYGGSIEGASFGEGGGCQNVLC